MLSAGGLGGFRFDMDLGSEEVCCGHQCHVWHERVTERHRVAVRDNSTSYFDIVPVPAALVEFSGLVLAKVTAGRQKHT